MHRTRALTSIAILSGLFGGITGAFAQDGGQGTSNEKKPRFTITGTIVPRSAPTVDTDEQFEDYTSDGRLIFGPQPSEEQLRAFAAKGGKVVVSMRTDSEMESLDFDEAALCAELGLEYIHIPVRGSTLSETEPRALREALRMNGGPMMLHCASGSRAATVYGLHMVSIGAMNQESAIEHALALGMSPGSVPYFQKALMKQPQRVISGVDAARLIDDVHMLTSFGTRHTLSTTTDPHRGIGAAREWVHSAFTRAVESAGKRGELAPVVSFDSHTVEPDGRRITREVEIVNVVCTIPGADPEGRDELIYVLAHLDSRASGAMDAESDAPGANDDGSGVAALIELARVLSAENLDTTIVLMATSGEEQGLFGARLHAQALKAQNANVVAVLNNDTIGDPKGVDGRSAADQVRILSEGLPLQLMSETDPERIRNALYRLRLYGSESDSPSRQLARYIAQIGKLHGELPVKPKLVFRPDRYLRGGDHTPFNELGFAAVRFCEVHENYDHQHQDVRVEDGVQYGDLATYVDPEYLAGVTKLNAATLVHLANAPRSPENTRILVAELSNDTTLRWDRSSSSDVAGYEIVWRDTTDPDWKSFKDVGDVTEATIDKSKDNWIFGVRAYDSKGYRSMVSFPIAARE